MHKNLFSVDDTEACDWRDITPTSELTPWDKPSSLECGETKAMTDRKAACLVGTMQHYAPFTSGKSVHEAFLLASAEGHCKGLSSENFEQNHRACNAACTDTQFSLALARELNEPKTLKGQINAVKQCVAPVFCPHVAAAINEAPQSHRVSRDDGAV